LGVLPGIIGSIQALEVLKLILGVGESLLGRLVVFDALGLKFRELELRKDPNCPVCGPNPTVTELIDYEAFCGVAAPPAVEGPEITVQDLARELDQGERVLLLDVREPREWNLVHLDNARLIPLGQLPARFHELEGHPDIVTYCHTGVRSLRAVQLLLRAGFPRARSLAGGIDAWARKIDRKMARY
ncbi:MAG: molybdenum cofactor biosynthesis protein MoeB, partial [Gemmatimonadales bacterium]|nr:molybdenum cofactor biosynthesis protein MoeB [Gemmatimonadales bacterium]